MSAKNPPVRKTGISGVETPDPGALKEKARDAIGRGRLPARGPEKVWGGPGAGNDCAVCADPVTADGLGFELQFEPDGNAPPEIHYVHIWCFAAWESERGVLQSPGDNGTIRAGERENRYEREPG